MWQVGSFNIKIIKDLNTKCTSVEYYLWVLEKKKTFFIHFLFFLTSPPPFKNKKQITKKKNYDFFFSFKT